jgi:nanoRNase/pAp phosphatase (c-di-AMP/oligoRNAs hydrolase)
MAEGRYHRLLTRSDFDGLVCAVLLKEIDLIDTILFVHPKDMQDGKIEITDRDITANLPYVEGVFLSIDHHWSETRRGGVHANQVLDAKAPSAARVVYDYYGGEKTFSNRLNDMMEAADKIDAALFGLGEVLNPQGWTLLGFITDSRTGFGRFKTFRISNYELMMDLIDHCRKKTIDEILFLPDVMERIDMYRKHAEPYRRQIERCSREYGNVLVTDFREEATLYIGNRFIRYALYPDTNISLQIMPGLNRQNTVITLGKSIFNKTSRVNIGELLLDFSGGGHENAGTCQVENDRADEILGQIVERTREVR